MTSKSRSKVQARKFAEYASAMAEKSASSPDAFIVTRRPDGKFVVLHYGFSTDNPMLHVVESLTFGKKGVRGLGNEVPLDSTKASKTANADGGPNIDLSTLYMLFKPKTVAVIERLMKQGYGVQVGKSALKVSHVVTNASSKPPAIPHLRLRTTITGARKKNGTKRFTHLYVIPGAKIGQF